MINNVEKEITELKEAHPNSSVIHGGLGGYVKPRPEPLSRLRKHLEEHNIKMIDVFRKFDPENNTTVSEPSFREAIKVCMCASTFYYNIILYFVLHVDGVNNCFFSS